MMKTFNDESSVASHKNHFQSSGFVKQALVAFSASNLTVLCPAYIPLTGWLKIKIPSIKTKFNIGANWRQIFNQSLFFANWYPHQYRHFQAACINVLTHFTGTTC